MAEGRLAGADRIGLKVGKIIDKYKMVKHFITAITDASFTLTRRADQIAAEAALDGIYVLRTPVPVSHRLSVSTSFVLAALRALHVDTSRAPRSDRQDGEKGGNDARTSTGGDGSACERPANAL